MRMPYSLRITLLTGQLKNIAHVSDTQEGGRDGQGAAELLPNEIPLIKEIVNLGI